MKDDYHAFTFDLDGTLAVSKSQISEPVAEFLVGLLKRRKYVGIISGAGMPQFETQVLAHLPGGGAHWERLVMMPTCGARMYAWRDGTWQEQYAHAITAEEYDRILAAFDKAFEHTSFPRPEALWGEQIEHRDTQVTFSAFGQKAPVEEKQKWESADAPTAKKQELVELLAPLLPEYSVRAGGMTSVDVTHKGVDKEYGINRFMGHTGLEKGDVLFSGDALYEGGNDHIVVKTGVDVWQVNDPQHLLDTLRHFARGE